MAFRFGIVGGGWYGCHIASSLRALGFEVKLFEQHDRLFHEASGNNQFRLHQGFHYARHSATRMQSRDGCSRFIERYPDLSAPVANNIYAVPVGDSLLDYDTYRLVMTSTGLHFDEVTGSDLDLTNIAGAMRTSERVLNLTRARSYFESALGDCLRLGEPVRSLVNTSRGVEIDGERFDFAIDASWGHFQGVPAQVFYEPTLLLYYEGPPGFPAVTLVDGPLCSIYPTEIDTLYTLSSVPFTPLGRCETAGEARAARDAVTSALVEQRRVAMEHQISRYVPGFKDLFRFAGPQLAIKTKPHGAFDDRSCHVFQTGNVFSVLSGKIDTIFFAVERILALIEADRGGMALHVPSSLREDIRGVSRQVEQR